MGVGKLLGPSLSVGNLEVVGFVGNLTGRVIPCRKIDVLPFTHAKLLHFHFAK